MALLRLSMIYHGSHNNGKMLTFLQLSEDGPGEEPSGDDMLSSFNEWALPAKEFDGMWERFGVQSFFSYIH